MFLICFPMPPPRPPVLTHVTLATASGARAEVTVLPEGRRRAGRALLWSGGVYEAELCDAEAVRLLRLLAAHYAAAPSADGGGAMARGGGVARFTLEVLLEGDAAEGGRRVAEAVRLVGLALGRVEDGEAEGFLADEAGQRRVSWRMTRRRPRRDGSGVAGAPRL